MKEIKLSRGKTALVDDIDFERANQYKWFALFTKYGFYAARNIKKLNGKNTLLLLHRFLLNVPPSRQVDHRNHNGLDNRRENLRICVQSQNMANRKIQSTCKTGFKGVGYMKDGKRNKRYRPYLVLNNKRLYLGLYRTAKEAALVYDKVALEKSGAFALTNQSLGLLK